MSRATKSGSGRQSRKAVKIQTTTPLMPSETDQSAGQSRRGTPTARAGTGEDRANHCAPTTRALPDLANNISTLRELAVQRRAAIKMQVKINNGIRALVGRACGFHIDLPEKERLAINKRAAMVIKSVEKGEPTLDPIAQTLAPFILTGASGRAPFDALRDKIEEDMIELAAFLPIYHFVEKLSGLGAKGLAIIIGEAGDLGQYSNPAKLWKRMGLAVMDGRRQGNPGKSATSEDWIAHGYNKERRSSMWQINDAFMKWQSQWTDKETGEIKKEAGPYGEIYMAKKAEYVARIEPSADLASNDPSKWTPIRADRAARRYVEKRLLRDLWRAWRAAVVAEGPISHLPPVNHQEAA